MNLDQYKPLVAQHKLEAVQDVGPVKCWRLFDTSNPHRDMEVTITPSGVTLVCNAFRKPVMHSGFTLTEWVSESNPKYLARRLLFKEWDPQVAEDYLTEIKATVGLYALSEKDPDRKQNARNIHDEIAEGIENNLFCFDTALTWQRDVGAILEDVVNGDFMDSSEVHPSEVYRADQVGLLAAYHDRFRALFMQQYDTLDNEPVPKGG